VWAGRTPEQGRLDASMRVAEADRLVRAVTRPYPGAFIDIEGRRLRVWAAEPDVSDADVSQTTDVRHIPTALKLADGILRVKECEWEPIPAGQL
jgi:methionyl-tRNA formyltransferase